MAITVSLDRFVDEMDLPSEDWSAFLNRRTGDFVTYTGEELLGIEIEEEGNQEEDWDEESIPELEAMLESEDFLPLPTKFEIHEWSIMDRFCDTIPDARAQEELHNAIRGTGAFRIFRDTINRMGIEDSWFRYRRQAFETIAVQWLERHGIAYEDRALARDTQHA